MGFKRGRGDIKKDLNMGLVNNIIGSNDLVFVPVLHPKKVDDPNADGPVVRYDKLTNVFDKSKRGIYRIVVNREIVYIGKYENGFNKRWLYTKGEYIYHHKRRLIADAINNKKEVLVEAAEEKDLKEQLKVTPNMEPWVNVAGIESRMINELQPVWNGSNK